MVGVAVRAPAPTRVVISGQSLVNIPVGDNMAMHLMSGLQVPWANIAVSGVGWGYPAGGLLALADTDLVPQARNRAGCTDILVMFGGQGDIESGGSSQGQVMYDRAIAYAEAGRDAGFQSVILTTLPAIGPDALHLGLPSAGQQEAIDDYNALVLANAGGFEGVADTSVAPLNDATSAYFNQDDADDYRLHLSALGAVAAADLIAPILEGLM